MSHNWRSNYGNQAPRSAPFPPSSPPGNPTSHGAVPRKRFTQLGNAEEPKKFFIPGQTQKPKKTSHGATLKKHRGRNVEKKSSFNSSANKFSSNKSAVANIFSSSRNKRSTKNSLNSAPQPAFQEDPFDDSDGEDEKPVKMSAYQHMQQNKSKMNQMFTSNKSSIQRSFSNNSRNKPKPIEREAPKFSRAAPFPPNSNTKPPASSGFKIPSSAQKTNFSAFGSSSKSPKSNGFQIPTPQQNTGFGQKPGFGSTVSEEPEKSAGFFVPNNQQKAAFQTPRTTPPQSDGFQVPTPQQKTGFGNKPAFGSTVSEEPDKPKGFFIPNSQQKSTYKKPGTGFGFGSSDAKPGMPSNLLNDIGASKNDSGGIEKKASRQEKMKGFFTSAKKKASIFAVAGKKRATNILKRKTKNDNGTQVHSENEDKMEVKPARSFVPNPAFGTPTNDSAERPPIPDLPKKETGFNAQNTIERKPFSPPAATVNRSFGSNNQGFQLPDFNSSSKPTFNKPSNNNFGNNKPMDYTPPKRKTFNDGFKKSSFRNAPKPGFQMPPKPKPVNSFDNEQVADSQPPKRKTFNNGFNTATKPGFTFPPKPSNTFKKSETTEPPKRKTFNDGFKKPSFKNTAKPAFNIPTKPKPVNAFNSKPVANDPPATSFSPPQQANNISRPAVAKPKSDFAGNLNMLLAGGKRPRQKQQEEIEEVPLAEAPKLAFNLQAEIMNAGGGKPKAKKKSSFRPKPKPAVAPKRNPPKPSFQRPTPPVEQPKPVFNQNPTPPVAKPPQTVNAMAKPPGFSAPQFATEPLDPVRSKPVPPLPVKKSAPPPLPKPRLEPPSSQMQAMDINASKPPAAKPPKPARPNRGGRTAMPTVGPLKDPRLAQVQNDRKKANLRASIKGLKNLASFWDDVGMKNKKKQELNPFSEHFAGKREVAQGNLLGSKSDERALKAQEWTNKEIDRVVQVIKDFGTFDSSTNRTMITFGELFLIYEKISDTLVFMLLKAKKRNRITFDAGEMLLQGRDDHVEIFVNH